MFDRTVKLVSDATIGVVIVLVHVMLAERRAASALARPRARHSPSHAE